MVDEIRLKFNLTDQMKYLKHIYTHVLIKFYDMCLYSDKYHFAEAELFCGNKTKIKNIYNLIEVEIDRRLQCLIRFYTKKDKDFKKLPIKEFIQKYLKVDFDPEIFDSQIIYVRLENL